MFKSLWWEYRMASGGCKMMLRPFRAFKQTNKKTITCADFLLQERQPRACLFPFFLLVDKSSIKNLEPSIRQPPHMSRRRNGSSIVSVSHRKILTVHSGDLALQSQPAAMNCQCGWCCSWRFCWCWIGIPFCFTLVAVRCSGIARGLLLYCTGLMSQALGLIYDVRRQTFFALFKWAQSEKICHCQRVSLRIFEWLETSETKIFNKTTLGQTRAYFFSSRGSSRSRIGKRETKSQQSKLSRAASSDNKDVQTKIICTFVVMS